MHPEPTAEELALARKIASQHMSQEWDEIVLGWWDHLHEIQIALAAIRETTSLGCAWLESVAAKRSDRMKVEALRTNAHLKDIGHDA